MALELVLTPHGLLTLRESGEALALEPEQGLRLEKAFARGSGHGLLWLGASEVGTALRRCSGWKWPRLQIPVLRSPLFPSDPNGPSL